VSCTLSDQSLNTPPFTYTYYCTVHKETFLYVVGVVKCFANGSKCLPSKSCTVNNVYVHRRRRRGAGAVAPSKKSGKTIFSGKNRVKFGYFVNFSCIYFRAEMSCPKVD